jgi:hypothetical protein
MLLWILLRLACAWLECVQRATLPELTVLLLALQHCHSEQFSSRSWWPPSEYWASFCVWASQRGKDYDSVMTVDRTRRRVRCVAAQLRSCAFGYWQVLPYW